MEEVSSIILHLQNAGQIVSKSDFRKHRLSDEAEDFLLEEAYKFPLSSAIQIKLYFPDMSPDGADEIAETIHDHFAYLKQKAERKLSQTLKVGWINLLIGSAMLGLLVLLVIFIGKQYPESGFSTTIQEIIIILGWVIIWRPVEALLYDWRPYKREANLYGRLSQSSVVCNP